MPLPKDYTDKFFKGVHDAHLGVRQWLGLQAPDPIFLLPEVTDEDSPTSVYAREIVELLLLNRMIINWVHVTTKEVYINGVWFEFVEVMSLHGQSEHGLRLKFEIEHTPEMETPKVYLSEARKKGGVAIPEKPGGPLWWRKNRGSSASRHFAQSQAADVVAEIVQYTLDETVDLYSRRGTRDLDSALDKQMTIRRGYVYQSFDIDSDAAPVSLVRRTYYKWSKYNGDEPYLTMHQTVGYPASASIMIHRKGPYEYLAYKAIRERFNWSNRICCLGMVYGWNDISHSGQPTLSCGCALILDKPLWVPQSWYCMVDIGTQTVITHEEDCEDGWRKETLPTIGTLPSVITSAKKIVENVAPLDSHLCFDRPWSTSNLPPELQIGYQTTDPTSRAEDGPYDSDGRHFTHLIRPYIES